MYGTSQKFKSNIYAPARMNTGRVTFEITDVSAIGDVVNIDTPIPSTLSDKQQLINRKRIASYKLASCETDRFKLDGSFSFPDDTVTNNGEIGFISDELCDSEGLFTQIQVITVDLGGLHSSAGVTITFDEIIGEYATDFNVSAYDSNTLISSTDVVGNTDVMVTPIDSLENYNKIVITIQKWCKGDRRARVMAVDFGTVKAYTHDHLINMKLVEEVDLTSSKLPSTEFQFTVDNSERKFNILNPTGFYKYLQQRQPVVVEIGLDIGNGVYEFVPLGEYLLWEWKSDEGSLTATFTTRTNLDLMANYDYEQTTTATKSLYQLAVDLFAICGITNYSIDGALQTIQTDGLVEKTNCRNVLQMVAIAGRSIIYITRDNTIVIKQVTMGSEVDNITMENQYQEPKIVLDKTIKQVQVAYWTDLSTSSTVTVNSSTDGDTLKLEKNTLINSSTHATDVANWIIAQSNYRATYTLNWRGNQSHELTDVVMIENSYGQSMKSFITKNEIEYAGYLSARTETKGGVN